MELVHFRKRIGAQGMEWIIWINIGLYGELALEDMDHADTTVQERTSHTRQTAS
jgi:IS5 family transposase